MKRVMTKRDWSVCLQKPQLKLKGRNKRPKKPSAEELKHKSKLNERGLRLKRQNAPE